METQIYSVGINEELDKLMNPDYGQTCDSERSPGAQIAESAVANSWDKQEELQ